MLKQVVGETRRNQFVKALRSLLSLTMLFRDNENSIPQKLAVLESGSIPPRRSAEEDHPLRFLVLASDHLALLCTSTRGRGCWLMSRLLPDPTRYVPECRASSIESTGACMHAYE